MTTPVDLRGSALERVEQKADASESAVMQFEVASPEITLSLGLEIAVQIDEVV